MALPTLKTLQPRFRRGTVVLVDNVLSSVKGYEEFMAYIRDPANMFQTTTLPFTGGFEMIVYNA